jgi:hemoglobin
MRRLLFRLSLTWFVPLLLHLSIQPARAQATDDSLFRELGGQPGLAALMDDFVPRLYVDARMKRFFDGVNPKQLKTQLASQFCVVSGGPCTYEGADMKSAHAGSEIRKGDFNALVELLQQSMSARDIPFRVQNRLLARLAPMHRDIVNTP